MVNTKAKRLIEFILLFVGLPAFVFWEPFYIPRIPVLLVVTVSIVIVLWRDRSFDNSLFWNYAGFRKKCSVILLRSVVISLALFVITALFWRPLLFGFVHDNFWLWLAVLFVYPVVSAYPQELIYRVFFFHRYKFLFTHPRTMIFMSALSFAFLHIIYNNWVAVCFTLCGGLVFALNYHRNRSGMAAALEHAVYGDLLFTLGMGGFFYN